MDQQGESADFAKSVHAVDHDCRSHLVRDALELGAKAVVQQLVDDPPGYPILVLPSVLCTRMPGLLWEFVMSAVTHLGGDGTFELVDSEGRFRDPAIDARELRDGAEGRSILRFLCPSQHRH